MSSHAGAPPVVDKHTHCNAMLPRRVPGNSGAFMPAEMHHASVPETQAFAARTWPNVMRASLLGFPDSPQPARLDHLAPAEQKEALSD